MCNEYEKLVQDAACDLPECHRLLQHRQQVSIDTSRTTNTSAAPPPATAGMNLGSS